MKTENTKSLSHPLLARQSTNKHRTITTYFIPWTLQCLFVHQHWSHEWKQRIQKKKAKIPQSFLKVKKVLNGTKIWLISNILKEKQGLQCRKFSNVTIIAKLQSVLLRWYFHTGEPQTNKWHYLSKEFLEIIISHVFFGIHLSASLNIAKLLIFISESQREIKKIFSLSQRLYQHGKFSC